MPVGALPGLRSSPHHALSEWKLAFIVDVTYEEVADIKRLKLDFTSELFITQPASSSPL